MMSNQRKHLWDVKKAEANLVKHGISFEEAITVFDDSYAVIFDDELHSNSEAREIIIGHSNRNRLLLVVFVERVDHIRIISARRATAKERRDYAEGTR